VRTHSRSIGGGAREIFSEDQDVAGVVMFDYLSAIGNELKYLWLDQSQAVPNIARAFLRAKSPHLGSNKTIPGYIDIIATIDDLLIHEEMALCAEH